MRIFTSKNGDISVIKIGICAVIGAAAIITFCNSLTKVPVGSVGVKTNMGSVTGNLIEEGWHFKIPFVESVTDFSIRQEIVELPMTQGSLKGKERVYLTMKMGYSLNGSSATEVYRNYGQYYIDNLMPVEEIFDIIKSVTAEYEIDDFAAKREEVMQRSLEKLRERFSERGINITSLSLSDYNFEEQMEQSIEEMNIAIQEQKTQKTINEVALENAKNRRLVAEEQANAEAEKERIAAQGRADAVLIEAQAQAEANKKLAESITPEIIEYNKIQQWDGANSKVVTSSDGGVYVGVGE